MQSAKNTGSEQIIIQKQDGTKFTIFVNASDTISDLKNKIQDHEGIRPFQQRLSFNSTDLEDQETVGQHQIKKGAVLKLVKLNLRDIGVFDQHYGSINRHMLSTQKYRSNVEEVNQLIQAFRANPHATFSLKNLNIDDKVIKNILKFLDERYQQQKNTNNSKDDIEDLKVNLARQELVNISGQGLVHQLQDLFSENYNQIILRRCEAHGKLINFHTDVSLKTLQLSLNDDSDYVGGRLMYATEGQIHIPERNKGTVTIHNNQIVHGVTLFKSGVRYGLFLLKK